MAAEGRAQLLDHSEVRESASETPEALRAVLEDGTSGDSEPGTNAETQGNAESDTGTEAQRDAEAGTNADAGTDADAGTSSVSGTGTDSEPGASSDESMVVPEGPTGDAIRTVLGLLALMALAFLAGDPRVKRLEALFGVSQVVAAGLPFFVLGMIAHLPAVSLLTDEVLVELRPLLEFGLGWIGLTAGLQFDVRAADAWPRGTTGLTAVLTLVPFVTVALVFGLMLHGLEIPATNSRLLRDAATFGVAGCLAAPTASALLSGSGLSARAIAVIRAVATLDDIAGVTLLALLSAFYRPETTMVTWTLPGVGWLFMTLGLGFSAAILTYAVLRAATSAAEFTALLLGAVALAAGSASFFSMSPIVICFMSGLALANLPGSYETQLRASLERLERPIYLLFLLVAGALWRFDFWQGWLLLPVFVVARLVGRTAAARWARWRGLLHETPGEEALVTRAFVTAPIGALSIAIVVNVQTLYPGRAVPLMVTSVVGGALLSEALVQLLLRFFRPKETS